MRQWDLVDKTNSFVVRKMGWWRHMTWGLRHHFWAAAILVRHLGFLDFSSSPPNGQNWLETNKNQYINAKNCKENGKILRIKNARKSKFRKTCLSKYGCHGNVILLGPKQIPMSCDVVSSFCSRQDVKGNSSRRIIYPLSLIVIALMLLKFWRGGGIPPPPPRLRDGRKAQAK